MIVPFPPHLYVLVIFTILVVNYVALITAISTVA